MAIAMSAELQTLVMSALLKNQSLLVMVIDDLDIKYFTDKKYQYLYKLLVNYYKKYNSVPTEASMKLMINQYHDSNYGELSDIEKELALCYNYPAMDEKFIRDNVSLFIRRSRFEGILTDLIKDHTSNKETSIENVMQKLIDTNEYQVTDLNYAALGNTEYYKKKRSEIYGNSDSPHVIRSFIDSVNKSLTAGGYMYGDLVLLVGSPGTGKTAFMINEGVNAAMCGFNVLHVALGDVNEVSLSHRYMSRISGLKSSLFVENIDNYIQTVSSNPSMTYQGLSKRIYTLLEPPEMISADELRVMVNRIQQKENIHFDMILVDYAQNLKRESQDQYTSLGIIYNKLKALAQLNRSVVITGQQPQRAYFTSEIIPFEGVSESARSTFVVDLMLTLGKPTRDADIASVFNAKTREGSTGGVYRLKLNLEVMKMSEIDENQYFQRREELMSGNVSEDA